MEPIAERYVVGKEKKNVGLLEQNAFFANDVQPFSGGDRRDYEDLDFGTMVFIDHEIKIDAAMT